MRRNWFSGSSLRLKATGTTLAITVFALTIMATTGIVQIHHQIDAAQHRSANLVALGISRAMQIALSVRDRGEVGRLADNFLRDPDVLFVAIYGPSGQHLAEAVRDRAAFEDFQRGEVDTERCVVGSCRAESSDDSFAQPAVPGPGSSQLLGRIFVGLSTRQSIQAQVHQSRLMAIAAVAAGLFAAGCLFVTLGPWMRRLRRLTNASAAISRGDFEASIGDDREDEIGTLARSFDAMCAALLERDGKLREFTVTLQDQVRQRTSDLEAALGAAEQASQAKSLFLANMSHELRTPLNGVIGMVDLLLKADPNAQQRRYCDVAKSSARSLLDLINEILDFSKIEAGKLELDSTDFDLHQVVEGAAQMLGERAEEKKLELICGVGPGVPQWVSGDPVRLRQVIVNLITNAIKFTERGEVVVQAELQSQTEQEAIVGFSVRDSGIGIPRDRAGRLFQSFSQVDASTTRKFGGTGLGLAISKRLVEMMGGSIGVESEEGKGSVFSLTARFPRCSAPETIRQAPLIDLRGLRALVVDDNAASRTGIQAQLASWKITSDLARNDEEVLSLLRAAASEGERYQVVVLDCREPGSEGLGLAGQIRLHAASERAALITLGSLSNVVSVRELNERGIAAHLTKPVLPSQLYNAIVDAIAAGRSGRRVVAARPITEREGHLLAGVRILVAEDNEVNRMVASELLEQAGCICTMVVNGAEALRSALTGEFDTILMDCQMPELDGFEATRRIREAERANPPRRRLTIIALTANAIKGDRELCLAAGMDGYVTKPIDPVELFNTIRSLLPAERQREVREAGVQAALGSGLRGLSGAAVTASGSAPGSAAASLSGTAGAGGGLPIDLESLQRRCMGNRKLAAKALNKFNGSMDQEVGALAESIRKGDAKAAAASAHRIKGAAANVSAENVRRILMELEALAKADDLAQTEGRLDALNLEITRFREYLATAMSTLESEPTSGAVGRRTPASARHC